MNIIVSLVDSGVNKKYLLSDNRIIDGFSIEYENGTFIKSNSVVDDNGHGTSCINVILAHTTSCYVSPIKIFNKDLLSSSEMLINALEELKYSSSNIINLSLSTSCNKYTDEMFCLCNRIFDNGKIIVASYDNNGNVSYPAIFDNVIGVKGKFFSNETEYWFDGKTAVADRSPIMIKFQKDDFHIFRGGTSKAAALMSSMLANIWSQNKNLSNKQVIKLFYNKATQKKICNYNMHHEHNFLEPVLDKRLDNSKFDLLKNIILKNTNKRTLKKCNTEGLWNFGFEACFSIAKDIEQEFNITLPKYLPVRSLFSLNNLSYLIGDLLQK